MSESQKKVAKELVDILGCPACEGRPKVEIDEEETALTCTVCGRKYPIRNGIPVMLVDEAILPEKDACR